MQEIFWNQTLQTNSQNNIKKDKRIESVPLMGFYKCKICDKHWDKREIEDHVRSHFEGKKVWDYIEETNSMGRF